MQNDFAQNQQPEKATTFKEDDPKSSHDTPPPVLFGAGSFLVEKEKDFGPGEVVTTTPRKHHHINPDPGKNTIFPAHIKVVDGSGEILHRENSDCVITFVLDDDNTVIAKAIDVGAGRQIFRIDTDDGKTLDVATEKPTARKRQVRYKLRASGKDFSMKSVKITTKAGAPLYDVTLASLKSQGDDFKVMVWLEQA